MTEPWRNSEAKAQVKLLIESDELYMNMCEHELYLLSELFQQYPEDRFVINVANLKKSIKDHRQQVERQEAALEHDRQLFPKHNTKRRFVLAIACFTSSCCLSAIVKFCCCWLHTPRSVHEVRYEGTQENSRGHNRGRRILPT